MSYIKGKIPESVVNLVLKETEFFSAFVSLKVTVEVIKRFDSISIISSTYGSVASKLSLYLHLDPSCFRITKSKDTFNGLIGLNINSYSNTSFECLRLFFVQSTVKNLSKTFSR